MNTEYRHDADETLLARSVSEPDCFAELVGRYQAAFLRKGRSIIRDEDALADVVQDVFVKIYLNAGRFRRQAGASFRSWAYRILLNTCFTAAKKSRRERELVISLDPELAALAPDGKVLEPEARSRLTDLLVLISRLPLLLRRTVQLHLVEGRPQREVAALEGVSVGVVRTRLHRARKALNLYFYDQIATS